VRIKHAIRSGRRIEERELDVQHMVVGMLEHVEIVHDHLGGMDIVDVGAAPLPRRASPSIVFTRSNIREVDSSGQLEVMADSGRRMLGD
jgi:hypothetical protein